MTQTRTRTRTRSRTRTPIRTRTRTRTAFLSTQTPLRTPTRTNTYFNFPGYTCGQTVATLTSEQILTVVSSGQYAPNLNCTWVIKTAQSSCGVQLNLTSFNSASGDFLNIFNGQDLLQGKMLWKWEGPTRPTGNGIFKSSSDSMTVQFTSNGDGMVSTGFVAVISPYCTLPSTPTLYSSATVPSGVTAATIKAVQTGFYPNDLVWSLTFTAPVGCVMQFVITSFNTEADNDVVTIKNRESLNSVVQDTGILLSHSGIGLPTVTTIKSRTRTAKFMFETDATTGVAGAGFVIKTSSLCPAPTAVTYYLNDVIPVGTTTFTLRTTASGNYPPNAFSGWSIKTNTANCGIQLTLSAFNTEANQDFLSIYNGISNTTGLMLSRWSGAALPVVKIYKSQGASMFVQFSSNNNNVASTGFTASVVQYCPLPSPKTFYAGNSVGALTTFNLKVVEGGFYPNNFQYGWTRTMASGCVRITFSMVDTQLNTDNITIHNGNSAAAPLLRRVSGTTIPAATKTTGPSIFVRFASNGSVVKKGFTASVTSVAC